MVRLPPSLLRGVAVSAIAASLVLAHAAFASTAGRPSLRDRSTEVLSSQRSESALNAALSLADNCYLEREVETASDGRRIIRLVEECD